MTDREMIRTFSAFAIGMLVSLVVALAVMTGSTNGDIIEINGTSYVGVKANDRAQWFEFDPTQPITFEKVATVEESK